MAIFALTLRLKDDPRLIDEYLEHHRHIWPEVVDALLTTGLEDIKIYLYRRSLFMVMLAPDGFDPAQAFTEYRRHPVADRWDTLMKTYQEKVPEASTDQWWMPLEPLFDFAAVVAARSSGSG